MGKVLSTDREIMSWAWKLERLDKSTNGFSMTFFPLEAHEVDDKGRGIPDGLENVLLISDCFDRIAFVPRGREECGKLEQYRLHCCYFDIRGDIRPSRCCFMRW